MTQVTTRRIPLPLPRLPCLRNSHIFSKLWDLIVQVLFRGPESFSCVAIGELICDFLRWSEKKNRQPQWRYGIRHPPSVRSDRGKGERDFFKKSRSQYLEEALLQFPFLIRKDPTTKKYERRRVDVDRLEECFRDQDIKRENYFLRQGDKQLRRDAHDPNHNASHTPFISTTSMPPPWP